MFKSILLTLLLSTNVSFAQGVQVMDLPPDEEAINEAAGDRPVEAAKPHDPTATHEPHSHHDEEALLRELQAQKAKQAATAMAIEKAKDDFSNVGSGALADLQKSGELSLDKLRDLDGKTIKLLQDQLRASHMSKVPPELIRANILKKSEGKPIEQLFRRFPVLLDIAVDFAGDAEALPSLLGILSKQKLMRNYMYAWIVMFLLVMGIRYFVFPKKWQGFKKFSAALLLNVLFMTASMSLFYVLFKIEIGPSVAIIAKRF